MGAALPQPTSSTKSIHIHLVSDSTGETLNAVAKASFTQFETVRVAEHVYPLVRSTKQLERVFAEIKGAPGPILSTFINLDFRERLDAFAIGASLPIHHVIDGVITWISDYLELPSGRRQDKPDLSLEKGSKDQVQFAKNLKDFLSRLDECRGHDEGSAGDNRVTLPMTAAELAELKDLGNEVLKARVPTKVRSALRRFIDALQAAVTNFRDALTGTASRAGTVIKRRASRMVDNAIDSAGGMAIVGVAALLLNEAARILVGIIP